MMKTKCLICGDFANRVCQRFPGYQEGLEYSIYRCEYCESSFALPMESCETLYDLIYANIGRIPGYARYHRYFEEIKKTRSPLDYLASKEESYWATAIHLRKLLASEKRKLRILEIGCGLGYLTYALSTDGFDAKGMDISRQFIQNATEAFGDLFICGDLGTSLREFGQRYDLLVMNQVIEHIPDIKNFLKIAIDLLVAGGEILITTPNRSFFPPATIWETELPPIHLWWFGEKSFECLSKELKCTVTFFDFSEYYEKHYTNSFSILNTNSRKPIFDVKGLLKPNAIVSDKKRWLRNLAEQKKLIKPLRTVRDFLTSREPWKGNRGPVCCVILKSE